MKIMKMIATTMKAQVHEANHPSAMISPTSISNPV